MDDPSSYAAGPKPVPPILPRWAIISGWLALAVVGIGSYVFQLPFLVYVTIALIPATAWLAACAMQVRAEKHYRVEILRWEISNMEAWIRYHEDQLKDGQPWFDDQAPAEWEFDRKYSARQAREKLEELRNLLMERVGSNA